MLAVKRCILRAHVIRCNGRHDEAGLPTAAEVTTDDSSAGKHAGLDAYTVTDWRGGCLDIGAVFRGCRRCNVQAPGSVPKVYFQMISDGLLFCLHIALNT